MSEDTDTKPVDEATDAGAKPAAEAGADARNDDDLDKLLSQYDEDVKPGPSKSEPEPKGADPDLKVIARELQEWKQTEATRQFRQDMDKVIKSVRGDLDADQFDDKLMESWIDAQARDDPRLSKAWTDRHSNPKAFNRVVESLGRNFHKKWSKLPSREVTEDRDAVIQAVRGASTKAPEGKAPNYGGMSNNEFAETVEKEYGFRPL